MVQRQQALMHSERPQITQWGKECDNEEEDEQEEQAAPPIRDDAMTTNPTETADLCIPRL
jgi:hypothetical protein